MNSGQNSVKVSNRFHVKTFYSVCFFFFFFPSLHWCFTSGSLSLGFSILLSLQAWTCEWTDKANIRFDASLTSRLYSGMIIYCSGEKPHDAPFWFITELVVVNILHFSSVFFKRRKNIVFLLTRLLSLESWSSKGKGDKTKRNNMWAVNRHLPRSVKVLGSA